MKVINTRKVLLFLDDLEIMSDISEREGVDSKIRFEITTEDLPSDSPTNKITAYGEDEQDAKARLLRIAERVFEAVQNKRDMMAELQAIQRQ